MKPEELRKIATESSQQEYDQVIKLLKSEAEKGALSCGFMKISDAVINRLESNGFNVNKVDDLIFSESHFKYIVKFD
ncbi:hypothetical protein NAL32_13330 [Chryseobacterium sp. Ch-15]|uniref:Uncharacterized protein n=1 Tax=Chryseobacterium muglaense TaxID=2893752 RepID=A0A9Q3YV41_9FLAO|nr:hypothetical protein [Chryseobacterium muglaense]MBD3905485.1 hypothetical protein [Chryseobacterium muglaense]MCC9036442.1 hypothetical protein [Chryseobacterium muglaense]MCM2555367.1 hypothetical protein [Chryseobacterium muglaense]